MIIFKKSIIESLKPDKRIKRKNNLYNPPVLGWLLTMKMRKKKDAFYDIITRAPVWHGKDTFNEQDYSITMWYMAKQKQRRKKEKKEKI